MEPHLLSRPRKAPFDLAEQVRLRDEAVQKIKSVLLPDAGIEKIVLIGSSVKGSFGKYDPPGFRGSLFSDFDFIVFVADDYQIPSTLTREPDGRPFPDDALNLAYRQKNFLRDTYDAEIFFIRKSSAEDPKIRFLGEEAGIPMTAESKHPRLEII